MTVSGAYMRSTFYAFTDDKHDGRQSVKIRDAKELKSAARIGELRQAKSVVIEDETESLEKLPQSLTSLDNINELVIKYCKTKSLPPKMAALKHVTRLELNETHLKDVDVVCKMTSLKELQLSRNAIKQLPAAIGELRLLEQLDLSSNFLSVLPSQIGQLRNLLRLSVSANRLHHLPHSLGNFSNLRSLDVSRNVLEALPDELGKLAALSELHVAHNKLDFFPESLRSLRKLKFLYASNNQLTEITDAFTDLVALTNLHLQNNKIARISGCPPNVVAVNLAHNHITDVSLLWRAPRYIKNLDLSGNRISELPASTPGHAQCLRMLNLSGNPLESLPVALSDCINLNHFNLSKTPVPHVPHEILHLPKLTVLNLFATKLDPVLQSAASQGIHNLRRAYQEFVPSARPDLSAVQPRPRSEGREETGKVEEQKKEEVKEMEPITNPLVTSPEVEQEIEEVEEDDVTSSGKVETAAAATTQHEDAKPKPTVAEAAPDVSSKPAETKSSPRDAEANNNSVSGVNVKDMKSVFQAKPSLPPSKPKPAPTADSKGRPSLKDKPVISSKPQFNGARNTPAVFSRPT